MSCTAHIADGFLEHFTKKVLDIRSQLASRPVLTVNADHVHCEPSCSVSAFSGIATDGVISLVTMCPTKTNMFRSLPISLVKADVDILAPTLATIINMSLESDTVPATFNHAMITPTKETKPGSRLDEQLPANVKFDFASTLLERHTAVQLHQRLDNNDLLDIF